MPLFIRYMKIHQLKKLIQEVIREVETETGSNDPKTNSDPLTLPNVKSAEKKGEELVLKMTLRGVKPGAAYKKIMTKLTKDALAADLQVIRTEIEKAGSKVGSLSPEEIRSQEKSQGKSDSSSTPSPDEPLKMPSREQWRKMSPEERDMYITPGEKELDWKGATDKDTEDAQKKAKLRTSQLKSGTLEFDPTDPDKENPRPKDTSLWTDKEWEAWGKQNPGKKGMVGNLRFGGSNMG